MSSENGDSRTRPEEQPAVPCWFCEHPHPLSTVLHNSILMAREERQGGPYYLFVCPYCLEESMVEETPRGRWFASPRIRIGLLDYLFSWTQGSGRDAESETILQAISWFRENEDRRRYFFARDGDDRYLNTNFLRALWPWGGGGRRTAADETRRPGGGDRAETPGSGTADDRGAEERADERGDPNARERLGRAAAGHRIPTPHEVLGVPPGASLRDIQRQFHRLAVQYHPDKVHHLGDAFREEAHRRFVELERAYRTLLARHRD